MGLDQDFNVFACFVAVETDDKELLSISVAKILLLFLATYLVGLIVQVQSITNFTYRVFVHRCAKRELGISRQGKVERESSVPAPLSPSAPTLTTESPRSQSFCTEWITTS